ncbi:MAG: hypothetical protein IH964_10145 [Candidatus Dadabacteria bacterium]|nr:hypothetical protein [Candidatus Dadabacteria bacterium]
MKILDDFKKLDILDDSKLQLFIEQLNLNTFEVTSDFDEFENWCTQNSIEMLDGKQLLTFIRFSANYVSDRRDKKEGLDKLKNELFGHKELPPNLSTNWEKLRTIIDKSDDFILNMKQQDLTQIGKKLSHFGLVCDVRPVFDLHRDNVLKLLYPIVLNIRHNESIETLSLELSEENLREIFEEAKFALKKLDILKKNIYTSKDAKDV